MLHFIGELSDSTSCIQAPASEARSKADYACGSRTVCTGETMKFGERIKKSQPVKK